MKDADDSSPIQGAQVYLQTKSSESVSVSDVDGSYSVHDVCLPNLDLTLKRAEYVDKSITVTNKSPATKNIQMKKISKL